MSHSHNFVSELVIMAKAMEELPIVKAELEQAYQRTTEQSETIQRLELRILDMKNGYDTLSHSMSKMEADRDEAVKAFLEADDRAQQAVGFIRSAIGNAASFLQAVEPAPAVPVVQPEVSEAGGIQDTAWMTPPTPAQPPVGGDVPQGQSVPDPTPAPVDSTTGTTTPAEPTAAIETTGDATNIDSVASGPLPDAPTTGLPEPTSPATPATNTDAAPNTTSPESDGSSGNTDSGQSAAGEPTASTGPTDSPSAAPSSGVATTAPAQPDDVGYHNEPIYTTDGEWYSAWRDWSARMDAKYGAGNWSKRG